MSSFICGWMRGGGKSLVKATLSIIGDDSVATNRCQGSCCIGRVAWGRGSLQPQRPCVALVGTCHHALETHLCRRLHLHIRLYEESVRDTQTI